MGDSIGLYLLFQLVLIALNAVFASAEIAVLSISETKLEHMARQGNRRAARLYRLTREPAKFLAAIQVAVTLSGFLGSAFAADNFSEPLVNWIIGLGAGAPRSTLNNIAVVLITLILSCFTLVFGELVPKRIAMKKPEALALGLSGLVGAVSLAFKPIVWFLSLSTDLVLRLLGVDPRQQEEQVSEEEIRMLVDAGSENGVIDRQEKEFIQNVFEFNDITAGDVATHRTDVILLRLSDGPEAWARTIHGSRHTRYPVCDGSPDRVVGVLNAKDYFRLSQHTQESILASAVAPAYFVPETIKADVLFRNMKKEHSAMAVVLDEYGGMAGIVTMNDLIEELVGTLEEDAPGTAAAGPRIEQLEKGVWVLTGNVELPQVEQALGVDLGTDEVDTFSGLVFHLLGMIPGDGDQDIELTFRGLSIHISRIENHQIVRARIFRPPAAE